MHILIYDIRILETVATEVWYSCLTKGHKLSHFRWCLFKFYNILTRFSICFFFIIIHSICMQMRVNTSPTKHLYCMCMCLWGCLCDLPDVFECVTVFVPWCTSVRGRVSVHGYCSLEQVCMSTILVRACEGRLSMGVLLPVQSFLRQQGAPFQFTHQPRRWGVKARGIAVGDFTFEGRDYLSGDPCVEVMREGDCRGTVWGCWDCLGSEGVLKEGRAERLRNL